jgi:hypothetical protein
VGSASWDGHRDLTPEFLTDVGTTYGEKIDYAIRKDGERHDTTCVVNLYKRADRLLTPFGNYARSLPLPCRQAHQLHSDETRVNQAQLGNYSSADNTATVD